MNIAKKPALSHMQVQKTLLKALIWRYKNQYPSLSMPLRLLFALIPCRYARRCSLPYFFLQFSEWCPIIRHQKAYAKGAQEQTVMDTGLSGRSRLLIAAAIIAVFLSIVFSAFETSITSSDRFKIKLKANKGSLVYRKISALIDKYDETISSILVLINASHASYAAVTSFLFSEYFDSKGMATGILVSGFAIFLFGEMMPKLIALSFRETTLIASAIICMPFLAMISPISQILHETAKGIIRIFSKDMRNENAVSEDDIKSMAETASMTGNLDPQTKALIEHALSFDDKNAASIMTKYKNAFKISICDDDARRTDDAHVIAVSDEKELLAKIDSLEFTRYPVIDANNKLLGVLNTRIFLQDYFSNSRKINIAESLLPPYFVQPQIKIDDCLRELSRNRTHLGFVKDQNGRIEGIITIEDIVEELIGEVDDEKTIRRAKLS